jgi:cytidylate kinase
MSSIPAATSHDNANLTLAGEISKNTGLRLTDSYSAFRGVARTKNFFRLSTAASIPQASH